MIVIAMATSGMDASLNLTDPKTLSDALSAIAGSYAPYLFAVGLVAAAFMALVVISLASSWATVETLGWKTTGFSWVYVLESLPAVFVPILFTSTLNLILDLMVLFVFILVGPGILLGLIASDARIMGPLVSSRAWKVGYWVSLAVVLGLGLTAVFAGII